MRHLKRFEVISAHGNILGYAYGRDIDHAYANAARRYRVPFALIGPGALAA